MKFLELHRKILLKANFKWRCFLLTAAAAALAAALAIQIDTAVILAVETGVAGQSGELGAAESNKKDYKTTSKSEKGMRYRPTEEELKLMARAVYSEARGEIFDGQVAVAAVIFNRIDDPRFPGDISGVIFEPLAFTAVADGQFWLEPDDKAYRAVDEALKGKDPSRGAVFYYNPVTATSKWIFSRPTLVQIGRHVFAS